MIKVIIPAATCMAALAGIVTAAICFFRKHKARSY